MNDTVTHGTQLSETTTAAPTAGWRAVWAHWMKLGHAIGVVQTRILMVVFYFLFVMPMGLVLKLRGDPLRLAPRNQSNWWPHQHQERSLEATRRQF